MKVFLLLLIWAIPALAQTDLTNPAKKDIAMQLVSSAENSTLDWRSQFSYIQDIGDGRGYTAGLIGFTTGTADLLELVQTYTRKYANNGLAKYLPALNTVNGTDSHQGLDPGFKAAWRAEAALPAFQNAQEKERDDVYFTPAVALAKQDGLRALGQFAYYDAAVVHGFNGLRAIRKRTLARAQPPANHGSEATYLNAFLDERVVEMKKEAAHSNVSRIEAAQRIFLNAGNFNLKPPLDWHVYGDAFHIP